MLAASCASWTSSDSDLDRKLGRNVSPHGTPRTSAGARPCLVSSAVPFNLYCWGTARGSSTSSDVGFRTLYPGFVTMPSRHHAGCEGGWPARSALHERRASAAPALRGGDTLPGGSRVTPVPFACDPGAWAFHFAWAVTVSWSNCRPPTPRPLAKWSPLLTQHVPSSPASPGPSFSSMELQTLVDAREVEEPPCWELCKGTETTWRHWSEGPSVQVSSPAAQEVPAPTTRQGPGASRTAGWSFPYLVRMAAPSRPGTQELVVTVPVQTGRGSAFLGFRLSVLWLPVCIGRVSGTSPPSPTACVHTGQKQGAPLISRRSFLFSPQKNGLSSLFLWNILWRRNVWPSTSLEKGWSGCVSCTPRSLSRSPISSQHHVTKSEADRKESLRLGIPGWFGGLFGVFWPKTHDERREGNHCARKLRGPTIPNVWRRDRVGAAVPQGASAPIGNIRAHDRAISKQRVPEDVLLLPRASPRRGPDGSRRRCGGGAGPGCPPSVEPRGGKSVCGGISDDKVVAGEAHPFSSAYLSPFHVLPIQLHPAFPVQKAGGKRPVYRCCMPSGNSHGGDLVTSTPDECRGRCYLNHCRATGVSCHRPVSGAQDKLVKADRWHSWEKSLTHGR